MLLYHGSNKVIKKPDLSKSRKFLDFGKGFYVSVSKKQAENRAKLTKTYLSSSEQIVNIYEFTKTERLKVLNFQTADVSWLNFVLTNRKSEITPTHDIVIGPTANDNTILVIDQFFQGIYDHLENPKEFVIKLLQPEKLETQYLFATENALNHLTFKESYNLW